MSIGVVLDKNSNNELSIGPVEDAEDSKCKESKIEDVLELLDLSDKGVVNFLRRRYADRKFYTWAGQTLLAVHPFDENSGCENADCRKPSVNAVISRVWFKLTNDIGKANQAIVISGDSGSGKTFSACLAIKHIADKQSYAQGNPSCSILWQTWCSVPLLTAFGNAATSCNHNSSRFGKLTQLQLKNNQIVGAYVQTYMLEKSRVSMQNRGEGNFHIFHQILESLDEETLTSLQLHRNVNYKIVPQLKNSLKSTYDDTLEAMEILKITELKDILTVLAVILNLGNVEFVPCFDYYTVLTDSSIFLDRAALLLKTEPGQLVHFFTNRHISATSQGKRRMTCYSSPCINPDECIERRNCFMRHLYDKLFTWLVKRINQNICNDGEYKLLGILDIYGFEVYECNTFEQLCINYANERLQYLFVNDYLKRQQEELKIEFLLENIQKINDSEYRERISLLDGPISIFSILNEECTLKRFSNDIFVTSRISVTLNGKKHFVSTENAFSTEFSVKHYAGPVIYNSNSMCAKNSDKVPEDMYELLYNCKLDFLDKLLEVNPYFLARTQLDPGKTILQKFKKSLDNLMEILNRADLHFIKCIKPNLSQKPKFFDEDVFLKQITANGIKEILKLNFQKLTLTFDIYDFQQRFSKALLQKLEKELTEEIVIGKSRIYLTQKAFEIFQIVWKIKSRRSARIIARFWERKMQFRNRAALIIQKFFRKVRTNKVFSTLVSRERTRISIISSCDSSCTTNPSNFTSPAISPKVPVLSPTTKVIQYFNRINVPVLEGDMFSLDIENIANNLQTKSFNRSHFRDDRVVSKTQLTQGMAGKHLGKNFLFLQMEKPKGLLDIL